jgi:hypothetical protein|mmetsp:Transcript_40898/g.73483  ORF Transcript_40898/g.73483 Transcript_40898/m.73483 type:complete len:132 (+) Transcript_40898:117-512(+)
MERKLRQAAEEEAARTAEALEAERMREEARRTEEAALVAARAEEDQAWYDSQSMKRSDRLAREEAARKREVRPHRVGLCPTPFSTSNIVDHPPHSLGLVMFVYCVVPLYCADCRAGRDDQRGGKGGEGSRG